MLYIFFSSNFCKIAYVIFNSVYEIINLSRSLRQLFRIISVLIS